MQPLHTNEARWFFQWDRLEIMRGVGLSVLACGIIFILLAFAGLLALPLDWAVMLAQVGIILFLLSCCLDCNGIPHEKRRLRCRACRAVFQMGAIEKNTWRCKKCGCVGHFDNIR